MGLRDNSDPREPLRAVHERLMAWLLDGAYPRWSHSGIDPKNFGFIETLAQDGSPLAHPRRARVHPRQAFAFAQAPALGWRGDVSGIVGRGMDYFLARYRRPDGLFRTLADADGMALDERALLYDQAFALLGYAAAATALEARARCEAEALRLRHRLEQAMRGSDGAFCTEDGSQNGRESNPHMHLLEACLAWAEIGGDPGWADRVRSLVDIAMSRFIRVDSGALAESFTAQWQPRPGVEGRIIEPGHQFEWAWLLLRCERWHDGPLRNTALRLLSIGERHGVRGGVAVNRLLDDFSVLDGNARFWPQTERLKAHLLAASLTGEPRHWSAAHAAAMSFLPYLATPLPGLWFDVQYPDGSMADSPAPASTFYHVVGAISALDSSLR